MVQAVLGGADISAIAVVGVGRQQWNHHVTIRHAGHAVMLVIGSWRAHRIAGVGQLDLVDADC